MALPTLRASGDEIKVAAARYLLATLGEYIKGEGKKMIKLAKPSLLASLLFTAPANAACLAAQDSRYSEEEQRYGLAAFTWETTITNRCNSPYDGFLSIVFRSPEGEAVHKTIAFVTLPPGGSETVEKTENLDERRSRQIERVEVRITEERERPW